MLHKTGTLTGYSIKSLNGEIGSAREFYFDDKHWTIRYLVVDTGDWLTGKVVLLSPYALVRVDDTNRQIDVELTKKQIEQSPSPESDKPVSRQFEEAYYGYYGWPEYWGDSYVWGYYPQIARNLDKSRQANKGGKPWNSHLRSTYDVKGHHIQAKDGEIGHVSDFIIDDESWTIHYLVIDTSNWWMGKTVLISPKWIERVSWSEAKVFVHLSRDDIKNSPEYHEGMSLTRDYEAKLHQHYNRPGYWESQSPEIKRTLVL